MAEVLIKAFVFVAIILLGYTMRRVGFFKEAEFYTISKIVLKITLPAAIVANFSQAVISPSMLLFSLLGFGGGVILILAGFLISAGKSGDERAFHVLNISGYNIGNFSMPFAQGFLGPVGVVTTSLFDTGNAVVCLGGSYSVAKMIKGGRISLLPIVKTLVKSIPFDAYVVMTVLSLLHIRLPLAVQSFAQTISGANAFLAMLMIGVGFKLSGSPGQLGQMAKILSVRYGVSLVLALVFYFCLPFGLEYRRALLVLAFSPIASAAPAFTGELKGDVGLSSAVNSASIVISIVLMTAVLIFIS